MLHSIIFFIGVLFGFVIRAVTTNGYTYYGTVKIDTKTSPNKDLMKFEFKRSPSDIKNYNYIYFDVDQHADLSQDKTLL